MEFSKSKSVSSSINFKKPKQAAPKKIEPTKKAKNARKTEEFAKSIDVTRSVEFKENNTRKPTTNQYVLKSRRSRREGWLWPGHNYLGPGNPLENGPTKSEADKIAKVHDYAYAHAWTSEHIKEADKEARRQFAAHAGSSIGAIAGYVGLGIKSVAEKVFGDIYPGGAELRDRVKKRALMASGYRGRKRWEYGSDQKRP